MSEKTKDRMEIVSKKIYNNYTAGSGKYRRQEAMKSIDSAPMVGNLQV